MTTHRIQDMVEPIREIHAQMRDAVVATTEAEAQEGESFDWGDATVLDHEEVGHRCVSRLG